MLIVPMLHSRKELVDDELVEMIHSPSMDEGALAAFVKVCVGG